MPSTLQAKVAFRKPSFPHSKPQAGLASRFPRIYFPPFPPMKSALFPLILKYLFEFSLRHSIYPLPWLRHENLPLEFDRSGLYTVYRRLS